jgi:hypothetical protein
VPIHEFDLLLTYKCNLECDHCFVFGCPDAKGVMKTSDTRAYDVDHEETYVDECHLCYSVRLRLREVFPEILSLDQLYGVIT